MANNTVLGTPTVKALTKLITIQVSYTGDDNINNSAVFEYKKTVDSTWSGTFPVYINRTTKTFHAVAFALDTATSYDVRLTVTDADGVTGSPWSTTVTTKLDGTRPLGTGAVYWVDTVAGNDTTGTGSQALPWKTITKAVASLAAGVTVRIKAGTYSEMVTVAPDGALGTIGNPITFEAATGETVIIEGGGTRANGILIGRYGRTYYDFVIRGITIQNNTGSNIRFSEGANQYLTVEDCTLKEARNSGAAADGGIRLSDGSSYLTARRNTFINAGAPPNPVRSDVSGIVLRGNTGGEHSIYSNSFSGGRIDDAVNTQDEGVVLNGWVRDSEFYDNTITDALDDGWQLEGGCARVVCWSNTVTNTASSYIGLRIMAGPAYVFRNLFIDTGSVDNCAVKTGQASPGVVYVVHNTWINPATGAALGWAGSGGVTNQIYKNNIFLIRGNKYYLEQPILTQTSNEFDYNLLWVPNNVNSYIVKTQSPTAYFLDLPSWRTASGDDANSIEAAPVLDVNYVPDVGSPAIDAAYYFPNVGDPPFADGVAPDIGALDSGTIVETRTLTVDATSNGVIKVNGVTKTAGNYTYNINTQLSLSAVPDANYSLDDWTGDLDGAVTPQALTMSADRQVGATFVEGAAATWNMRTEVVGQGSCSPATGQYADSATDDITFIPATNWEFVSSTVGGVVSTDNPRTVTFTADRLVRPTFKRTTCKFTFATIGNGTIDVPPVVSYLKGETRSFTATPGVGWRFVEWRKDDVFVSATNPYVNVLVDANHVITAVFEAV